jgi:hypothetical protein
MKRSKVQPVCEKELESDTNLFLKEKYITVGEKKSRQALEGKSG